MITASRGQKALARLASPVRLYRPDGSIWPAVRAATVTYDFAQVVNGTMAGSAPWVDVTISDTSAPGTLAFDVAFQPGATGSQTLTGLFFNIPVSEAASLTGIGISGASNSNAPLTFVSGTTTSSSNSVYSTSQSIAGLAAAAGGSYDLYVKFPNSGAGIMAANGTSSETFNLIFAGASPSASNFLTSSTPKAPGGASYLALAAFTNAGGTGGSGVAYVAPTPLPGAAWLLLSGLVMVGALAYRRGRNSHSHAPFSLG